MLSICRPRTHSILLASLICIAGCARNETPAPATSAATTAASPIQTTDPVAPSPTAPPATPAEFASLSWDASQGKYITTALCANNHLWIGTEDQGLWQSDGAAWKQIDFADHTDNLDIRSLAVDRLGRLWVGRGWHGISVFNGRQWQTYDAPFGPLGHRVLRIALNPLDGNVWLATELGLTRYDVAADRWSSISRMDGLPSDQLNALAFAPDGTLYVATQCEGLAIGHPQDNYHTWQHVEGPDRAPTSPTGHGLPSCLLNDLLVSRDGSIYLATDNGLALSADHGASWSFYRGKDYVAKVTNRTDGPPAGWTDQRANAPLAEDYVACLAEDSTAKIWLGYRTRGIETFSANPFRRLAAASLPDGPNLDYIASFANLGNAAIWIGSYGAGGGAITIDNAPPDTATTAATPATPPLPIAATVSPEDRAALLKKVAAFSPAPLVAGFLGDDWVARGDGIGRYGWQAAAFPYYDLSSWIQGYKVDELVGPHSLTDVGGPYTYSAGTQNESPQVLYIPNAFSRNQAEWNDGSFSGSYPRTFEGPDLWFNVTLPAETQRLTLFFINQDVHSKKENRYRDYLVEIKDGSLTQADANFAPALARTRVCNFYDPVYKSFLLAGGRTYWVKVGRNYSFVGKMNALFLDRAQPPAAIHDGDINTMPPPLLDPKHWGPPSVQSSPAHPLPPAQSAALLDAENLCNALFNHVTAADAVPLQARLRLEAYHIAADADASPELLKYWRWHAHLWTEEDRLEFCQQMDAAYNHVVASNPQLKNERTSMVDLYTAAHPH